MANFPTSVSTDSNLYIAKNNRFTALTAGVDAVVTTIPVVSTTNFPTVGFITIGTEAIKYTGLTATTFTGCTRGADSTTAATHDISSTVQHTILSAHHNVLKDEIIAVETTLINYVTVKDFGAVGDGVTNDTAAINSALATGKHVFFPPGTYMTTGGHSMVFDGQKLHGSGMLSADANGGTKIKKISGTNNIINMGAFGGLEVSNLTLDNNSLGGHCIAMSGTYHSSVNKVTFKGQGGTDYALFTTSTNVSSFRELYFDTGYGHIGTATAPDFTYYCTYEHIVMGTATGPYAMELQSVDSLKFTGFYCEETIYLHGNCNNVKFYNFAMESNSNTDKIVIDGTAASITAIGFYGGKFLQSTSGATFNFFDIKNAFNVTIEGFFIQDLVSPAGKNMILLNNVTGISISDMDVYSTNTFNFVVCTTAASFHIVVKDCNYHSGAAGTNSWLATYLVVMNSNMLQNFQSTTSQVTMVGVVGAINTANLAAGDNILLLNSPSVTDAGNFATQIYKGKDITPINQLANSATPSISAGGRLWRTGGTTTITNITDGVPGQEIVLISEHSITITHGTNFILKTAANFAMVSGDVLTLVQKADSKWYEVNRNAVLPNSLSSATLLGALTDETGTGAAVFANTPTIATPNIDTINLTGGQITFPATQSASAGANVLDDYEEGTWTGALVPQTSGSITMNGSFVTGAYTKIGRAVTVTGDFRASAISSPVGQLRLTGLPFTAASGSEFTSAVSVMAGDIGVTDTLDIQARIAGNTNYIILSKLKTDGTDANLAQDVGAFTQFVIRGTYFV